MERLHRLGTFARRALGAFVRRFSSLNDTAFVVLFVGLGYVLVARGVNNFYPFSTFSMYAATEESSASRVLARDAAGKDHEVSSFVNWSCEHPIDLNPSRCESLDGLGRYYKIGYVDREMTSALEKTRPTSPEVSASPVTVFRRIWRFADDGGVSVTDCELGACEAVPR